MRSTSLLSFSLLALAASTLACNAKNPNFCQGEDCSAIDAAVDGPPITCNTSGPDPSCPATAPICVAGECTGACTSDADCAGRPAAERICLVSSGACVECDENNEQADPAMGPEDECPGPTTAVCDGATHTCRACSSHSECTSGICDAGRCAPDNEIVFMAPAPTGADGGGCGTRASPCLTLNAAVDKVQASAALAYIFMAPSATPYAARNNNDRADFDGVTVYVLGTGASVERSGDGEVIETRGGSTVTIEGLTIKNATNTSGHGILCTGSSLTLRNVSIRDNRGFGITGSACTLSAAGSVLSANALGGIELAGESNVAVSRSTISNNAGGGISVNGSFKIVNNFIVGNGTITASTYGGVQVTSVATTNALEFNTIALNSSTVGSPDGITCNNAGLIARNNIIIGTITKPHVNAGSNCAHVHTLFTPDNAANGDQNMVIPDQASYMFVGPTDYHIRAGSAAAGRAQSSSLIGESLFDVDGEARIADGTSVDVGADEIP